MKIIYITLTLILIYSCGEKLGGNVNPNSSVGESPIIENEKTELTKTEQQLVADEKKRLAQEEATRTTMTFDRLVHDYGKIKMIDGKTYETSFKVTNTGKHPLIIQKVDASCGCTTPKKPEKPIAPGASDIIQVSFSPKAEGPAEKTITVTANTNPITEVLKIKADVSK